jgi:hypothetical protein
VLSPQQLAHWASLGADEITLQHRVNRDFPLLAEMLCRAKALGVGLRLIANNFCLRDCPFAVYHATGLAHSSASGQGLGRLYVDYNAVRCNTARFRDPAEMIASAWIRPEDVGRYEELAARAGGASLALKIVDRTKTTAFLAGAVAAYARRRHDGNLADILNLGTTANAAQFDMRSLVVGILAGRYRPSAMREYAGAFRLPAVHIENRALDGFIDRFVEGHDCSGRACAPAGTEGTAADDPRLCGYCRKWAAQAVRIDPREVAPWLDRTERFLGDLSASRLF